MRKQGEKNFFFKSGIQSKNKNTVRIMTMNTGRTGRITIKNNNKKTQK